MENVSIGAFIERNAEEIEAQALESLERSVAALSNEMKALRRATDRFGARAEQIRSTCTKLRSSMAELRNSIHRLEQDTIRSVNSSLPVAFSTMASHRPISLPASSSITGSVPPPPVPQTAVSAHDSDQIRSSCPDRIDRLPLSTTNFSSSSISSPNSISTFANFSQTIITSSDASVQSPEARIARIASSVSTITQIRTFHTDLFPPLNQIHLQQPHTYPTNLSPASDNTSNAPTTKLILPFLNESLSTLARIEKPDPLVSPYFRFEKPPTKFFTQNGPNDEALWASQNVSNGFLRTATDQSKASILAPDPTLHGWNNSDPAALVIEQTRDAVSHNKGKTPLLFTDDLDQPDAKLEHRKIEAPVLFRGMAPLFHPVNNLEMKMLPVSSYANSANLNTKSLKGPVAIGSAISLVPNVHARGTVRTLILDSWSMIRGRFSIKLEKSGTEQFLVEHERPGYKSLSLSRQSTLWPLEKHSVPPLQNTLGWWYVYATISSSSLEDHKGCKASPRTEDAGVDVSWWYGLGANLIEENSIPPLRDKIELDIFLKQPMREVMGPIKCFNPIRVFITIDWRVPIASSSLKDPPRCKMPYLDDRESVQVESANGVASLQTSFVAMWQIAWAAGHCLLYSWACQCAPGVAIIPVVRCFYIYGVLLFWISVFLLIISAQNWWCLREEYLFLYTMVLSLKTKSRRDFPNFGGISCEPCAYTKTTLERGPLKLTTAYGFGGSSMASIDRVGGGIYPQTAAVGTANVGKFIKPILKDHLRHSVVIADDVGANVGCRYQTYAIPSGAVLIATAILHDPYHMLGLVYNALGNKKTERFWTSSEEFSTEEILCPPSTQKSIASLTDSHQQQSNDRTISRTKGSTYLLRQKWKTGNSSPAFFNSMHQMLDASDAETSLAHGESGTSSSLKDGLVDEQNEWLRFSQVVQRKDFVHYERINGTEINVLQGLELHTGVFDVEEQKNIVEYVYKLQKIGRKGQLRARTYPEPRKWMRGKGHVTIQFGCCYNYAVDKDGNPPGIIRDEEVEPLPSMSKQIIKRMVGWHILPPSCVPSSCIVNIYDEGDCIPPHIDHHDFLRPFCAVSFLSKCNILFGLNRKIAGPGEFSGPVSISLPVGSVMILKGNGADIAKHCVPAVQPLLRDLVVVESRGNEWSYEQCRRQWDPGKYCVALEPEALEFYLCV